MGKPRKQKVPCPPPSLNNPVHVGHILKISSLCPFQTLQGLLKLWTHECSRVFEDRLVNNEDREWFQKLISKTMNAEFSVQPGEIVGEGPLLYGDFMMPNTDNKNYEEITDMEKVTGHAHTIHLGSNFIVDSSFENYLCQCGTR